MSEAEPTPATAPALGRSDAWLLAALAEGSHRGRALTLQQLIEHADWLNHAIPAFDEVSFGLPRLIAHGLATVDGLRLRATPAGMAVRRSVKGTTLGAIMVGMAERVGAPPYPEPEIEDRSLGRLPGLEASDFEAAFREYSRSMKPWVWATVASSYAAELVLILLAVRHVVGRLRRHRRS